MGTKKWSDIKKLSKATKADRADARAELEAEIRSASGPCTIQQIRDRQDELADRFEAERDRAHYDRVHMPAFVSGIELARGYYRDVVAQLVDAPHAAGRLGWGSDVVGYDTERSTDHGWGPHLHVLVAPDDV